MKDIERTVRLLGQVLQVRSWEVEQQRALFRDAAAALADREREQADVEVALLALSTHARERLVAGSALDVNTLSQNRAHGQQWQDMLHAAAQRTRDAGRQHDSARDALSEVHAQRRAVEQRRDDLTGELVRLAGRDAEREQDERHAARAPATGRPDGHSN